MVTDDLLDIIIEIIESTKLVAMEDHRLSKNEVDLLDTLKNELELIEQELEPKLQEMDLSYQQLYDKVKSYSTEIFTKVTAKAKEDGKITQEEMAILTNIISKLS